MDYNHTHFGSLAVRTRYAYQITYFNNFGSRLLTDTEIDELMQTPEVIVFRSARMALKALKEIETDDTKICIEYREIQIHC